MSRDLERRLDGAPFEAIVIVQLIEHVRHPVKMLTTLGKHLSAQGRLIAAVPNIMHGSVRLGFLTGHSPVSGRSLTIGLGTSAGVVSIALVRLRGDAANLRPRRLRIVARLEQVDRNIRA